MTRASRHKRRRWCLAAVAAAVVIVGAVLWFLHDTPIAVSTDALPKIEPALTDFLVAQLCQEVADRQAWLRRAPGGHVSSDAVLPKSVLKHRHPVHFNRERLISFGREVIAPLLKLATDPAQDAAVQEEAITVLLYFDDSRVHEAIVLRRLRVPVTARPAALNYAVLTTNHPDVLTELDRLVQEELATGFVLNEGILRWLNRIRGEDADAWLTRVAPSALRFRNAQLGRGYDPAIALRRLAVPVFDDEAIDALFSSPEDREGCKELLRVVHHDAFLPPQPGAISDLEKWRNDLRLWYNDNRSRLTYDFTKHRFVSTKMQATAPTGR